jgi:HPt (histidine-containing phosphotransfer) domain-containing protein
MNDFVSKPVQPSELLAAILRVCPDSNKQPLDVQAAVEQAPASAGPVGIVPPAVTTLPALDGALDQPPPIDLAASLERAGDPDFWQVLVDAYFDETAKRIAELQLAAASGDIATFTRAAHTIKGSSAELLAEPLRELAYALEQLGKTGSIEGYEPQLAQLQREFARLRLYIDGQSSQMAVA